MNNDRLKKLFKKVLFFLIITILLWLCKLSFVNAASFNDLTLTDDSSGAGGSWTTSTAGYYFNTNGYRTINFDTGIVGDGFDILDYQYGFISYCSYDNIYQSYRQNGTYSEEMQMFDTYVKSTIYNSSIPCTIKYITWKFKYNCGTEGKNCFSQPRLKFYGDVSDYSLRSYGYTKEPLQIDTSSGQIINQNATIITQNDTIIRNTDSTNKKLDDLNKNLTDESSPNLNGLENSAGWLKPGPVDSILNLPLSLLNNLTSNLSKSCSPVDLPLPFVNKSLQLPCLNSIYNKINGVNVFLNSIGVIASAFIIYEYLRKLYIRIDKILNFDNSNDWGGI